MPIKTSNGHVCYMIQHTMEWELSAKLAFIQGSLSQIVREGQHQEKAESLLRKMSRSGPW